MENRLAINKNLKSSRRLQNVPLTIASIWFVVFLIYILFPGKIYPFSMVGYYLSLIFCLIFLISLTFSTWLFKKIFYKKGQPHSGSIPLKTLNIFLVLGSIGLFFHLWDKVMIRNYDYFSCIDIRELWLSDGQKRLTKISSTPSALGHLLIYFNVIPAIFFKTSSRKEIAKIALAFLMLAIYCWTIVSRSTFLNCSLIIILSSVLLCELRFCLLQDALAKILIVISCLGLFTFFSFYKKMNCVNGVQPMSFTQSFMTEHQNSFKITEYFAEPASFSKEYRLLEIPFTKIKLNTELPVSFFISNSKIGYFLNMVPIYAGNGINNFTISLTRELIPDHRFIFNPFISGLNKLIGRQIIKESSARSYFNKGFINLPGAINLTLGPIGFYLIPTLAGIILASFNIIILKQNLYFIPIAGALYSVAALAPLTNAISLMSFPFIFAISLLFILLGLLRSRRKE